jgi:two-component system, response regulator YesN
VSVLSVIVVEDEVDHRRGIVNAVDWLESGLRLVGEAGNGEEGLALALDLKPDILIADVRMPLLDGIAMASRAKDALPGLKIIFLSGHGDYEYLSGALRVSAVDYLLKPVKPEDLARALDRAAAERRRELQAQTEEGLIREKLAESYPLIRERFVHDLLNGRVDRDSIAGRLDYLQLSAGEPDYVALAVRLEQGPDPAVSPENMEFDRYLLGEDIARIPEVRGRLLCAWMSDGELALVLGSVPGSLSVDSGAVESLTYQIVWHYRERGASEPTVGVGNPVRDLADIRSSYREATEALVHRTADPGRRIIHFADVASGGANLLVYDDVERTLVELVRAGKPAECESLLGAFFSTLDAGPDRPGYVRSLSLGLMMAAERARASLEGLDSGGVGAMRERWALVDSASDLAEIAHVAASFCASMAGEVSTLRISRTERIVQRARSAVEARYGDDLTLADLAASENLTPYYFGSIFKQGTGESFADFLSRTRMGRAAEFLLTGDDLTYEIARRVGYSNVSYFCSLFKNRYGVSPKRYRELHCGQAAAVKARDDLEPQP